MLDLRKNLGSVVLARKNIQIPIIIEITCFLKKIVSPDNGQRAPSPKTSIGIMAKNKTQSIFLKTDFKVKLLCIGKRINAFYQFISFWVFSKLIWPRKK